MTTAREIVAREDRIIAELLVRFPDKHPPHGSLTKVATDMGLKYSLITRAAKENGFSFVPKEKPVKPPRMFGPQPGSVRWNVLDEVRQKYPCQEIPYGIQSDLARKYGVSRQRIGEILKGEYSVFLTGPGPRHCAECSNELTTGQKKYCADHTTIPIECVECGTITRVQRSKGVHRLARLENVGPFCGKACHGAWLGRNHGKGGRANATVAAQEARSAEEGA